MADELIEEQEPFEPDGPAEPHVPAEPATAGEPALALEPHPADVGRTRRIRAVDFRRPTKFAREATRRMQSAHDSFCRLASTRLTAELRIPVELTHHHVDQLPFRAVVGELAPDALVATLSMRPTGGHIAMVVELPLAVALVDGMLGAGSLPRRQRPTGLTELELRVLGRVVSSICEPLSSSWGDLAGIQVEPDGPLTAPVNLAIAAPSEATLILSADMRVGKVVAPLTLALPHPAVEPLLEGLDQQRKRVSAAGGGASIRAAVSEVEVELRAEAGAVELPVEQILGLRAGDRLRLGRLAADGIVVYAGEVPAYVAHPGRNANRRAVRIVGACREPGT